MFEDAHNGEPLFVCMGARRVGISMNRVNHIPNFESQFFGHGTAQHSLKITMFLVKFFKRAAFGKGQGSAFLRVQKDLFEKLWRGTHDPEPAKIITEVDRNGHLNEVFGFTITI